MRRVAGSAVDPEDEESSIPYADVGEADGRWRPAGPDRSRPPDRLRRQGRRLRDRRRSWRVTFDRPGVEDTTAEDGEVDARDHDHGQQVDRLHRQAEQPGQLGDRESGDAVLARAHEQVAKRLTMDLQRKPLAVSPNEQALERGLPPCTIDLQQELPALELDVLERWRDRDVFAESPRPLPPATAAHEQRSTDSARIPKGMRMPARNSESSIRQASHPARELLV